MTEWGSFLAATFVEGETGPGRWDRTPTATPCVLQVCIVCVCLSVLSCVLQMWRPEVNFNYLTLSLLTLFLRKGLSLNLELASKLISSKQHSQRASHRDSPVHPILTGARCLISSLQTWGASTLPTEPSLQPSKATLLASVRPYCFLPGSCPGEATVFLQPS